MARLILAIWVLKICATVNLVMVNTALHTHYTCIESSTSDPAALLLTYLHTNYTGIEISTEMVKPFLPAMIYILTIRVLKLNALM